MEEIIKNSLEKSSTYFEYRKIVADKLLEGKSTGSVQSDDLLHYSKLNETRMNRLEKTIVVSAEIEERLKLLRKQYIWLVISEGWCGDAAQLLPVMHKMEVLTDHIDFKIVFRDENEALMNKFLTNGGKSIPKLIVLDKETLDVLADWGPRPKEAFDLVKNYKEKHGVIDETIKTELQMWYLHDKGISTQNELLEMMRLIEIQE
ncbi:thioredoxin family protein [Flavobacterium lindanitolerans]|uniref:thioredoxin family protein n=1 Tax=Flavobacterium lindanitolerans TaxID=428988 RepID=UPI0027BA6671|nr:thioredoxin family protein [Flavobacterium lindanitolerans]